MLAKIFTLSLYLFATARVGRIALEVVDESFLSHYVRFSSENSKTLISDASQINTQFSLVVRLLQCLGKQVHREGGTSL